MPCRSEMESLWRNRDKIKGLLLDINGVLYNNDINGQAVAIPGSATALKRLQASGLPVRLCTNETTNASDDIAKKLNAIGFDVTAKEIFAPAPAARQYMTSRGLRPHFLVHPRVLPEFQGMDCSDPNCVVIGDAQEHFSYANLNQAFNILVSLETPKLIAMGRGKYYKEGDGLALDVGPFTAGLEYACDTVAEVVGKPAKSFFLAGVHDMGLSPDQTLMIGDDIVNDVGGAQAAGLKGVQVRTGKYRASDEPHATVNPDAYVDDLTQAVHCLLD